MLLDLRDFMFLRRYTLDLYAFGSLRSVEWQFRTDVSKQFIGLIFKDKAVQEDVPSRRFGTTILRCVKSRKSANLIARFPFECARNTITPFQMPQCCRSADQCTSEHAELPSSTVTILHTITAHRNVVPGSAVAVTSLNESQYAATCYLLLIVTNKQQHHGAG